MNKSFSKVNLNNLSATSSEFLTEINFNIQSKLNNLKGGSCPCMDIFKAFKDNNNDLALYIINENKCCYKCKDDNGNTILHHIVLYCTKNNNDSKCLDVLSKCLQKDNVKDFIDLQNSKGETPILLSVLNNNILVANKLDQAGADKTIEDNEGNFLETDDKQKSSKKDSDSSSDKTCVNNIIKLFFNEKDKSDNVLTSLHFNSDTVNSEGFLHNLKSKMHELEESNRLLSDEKTSSVSNNDNINLDTDRFINYLSKKYNKKTPKTVDELFSSDIDESFSRKIIEEPTSEYDVSIKSDSMINDIADKIFKKSNDKQIDTDTLMNVIENIKAKQESKPMVGGKKREKVMGYRNLILHSEVDNGYVKNSNLNIDSYYTDSENGTTNELSRLIKSRKSEIHNEVLNMIMAMLEKGKIIKNSKPIEPSERNAKLVKAFIYRIVSEKNPQLTGMDKILMIKNFSEKEVLDILEDMPTLDELEKNIQKHLEEKHQGKETESKKGSKKDSKKEKKSKKSDMSSSMDSTISTESSENSETESVKKKKTKSKK